MPSLQNLFDEFLREQEFVAKRSPATIIGYKRAHQLFLKVLPNVTLDDLTSETIGIFFKELDTRVRPVGMSAKTGVKGSTIATYRSKLNSFFEWLTKRGYIQKNPFQDIPYPNVRYEDKKYLHKEEILKIFAAVTSTVSWQNNLIKKRNVLALNIALFCGVRLNELLNIRIIDIDLIRRSLTVQAETSKSRMERRIPLNQKVLLALEDYLEEKKKHNYTNPHLLVSAKEDEKMTKMAIKNMIKLITKKSGVSFHLHRFRHTFAINLINQGVDISIVKQLLGHRDIRMTQQYIRCLPGKTLKRGIEMLSFDELV